MNLFSHFPGMLIGKRSRINAGHGSTSYSVSCKNSRSNQELLDALAPTENLCGCRRGFSSRKGNKINLE